MSLDRLSVPGLDRMSEGTILRNLWWPTLWVALAGGGAGSYIGGHYLGPTARGEVLGVALGVTLFSTGWLASTGAYSWIWGKGIQHCLVRSARAFTPLLPLWSSPVAMALDVVVWDHFWPPLFFTCLGLSVLWKAALEPGWGGFLLRRLEGLGARVPPLVVLGALGVAYGGTFLTLFTLQYSNYRAGFDLAIFSNLLWDTGHGRPFFSSFLEMNFLGQHFFPGLSLVAPIYYFLPSPVTLGVIQVAAVISSALPVYWIARRELGEPWIATGITAVYLLLPVLDSILATADFHTDLLMAPFLTFALYYWIAGRRRAMLLSLAGVLLMKEDSSMLVVAFGIYLLAYVQQVRYGLAVLALGVGWFLLSFYLFIPAFGSYNLIGYYYGYLGQHPHEILLTALQRPGLVVSHLLVLRKFYYLCGILLPLLGIPLANLSLRRWNPDLRFNLVIIALPTIVENVVSDFVYTYSIGTWHSSLVAPSLIVPTIFALKRITISLRHTGAQARGVPGRGGDGRSFLGAAVVVLLLMALPANYYFSPLPTSKWAINSTFSSYEPSVLSRHVSEAADLIPSGVSVAIVYSYTFECGGIASHLASRNEVYLFPRHVPGVLYVVVFTAGVSPADLALVQQLLAGKVYEVIYDRAEIRLLRALPQPSLVGIT